MRLNTIVALIILSLNSFVLALETALLPIEATLFTSYRYDIFQWSLASPLTINNKLSELTWKNRIFETGVKIENAKKDEGFRYLGQLSYGVILNNSTAQDSDWDQISEFSRTFSDTKGHTLDLSGAIGISRKLRNFLVTYYLGMDYTKYQMKNYGLNYKINRMRYTATTLPLGQTLEKSQLITKYNFNNYMPWLGASTYYPINNKFSIKPMAKLYLFYLSAEADWFLRSDLGHEPSFIHKALGVGGNLATEIIYQHSQNLAIKAHVGIKKLKMWKGIEKLYFHDNTFSVSYIKDLSFTSSYASVGFKYKF